MNEAHHPTDLRRPSPFFSVEPSLALHSSRWNFDESKQIPRHSKGANREWRRRERSMLWIVAISFCFLLGGLLWRHRSDSVDVSLWLSFGKMEASFAVTVPRQTKIDKNVKVERWLQHNGEDRHAFEWQEAQKPLWRQLLSMSNFFRALGVLHHHSPRPKAALISLVRNEELDGIVQSMTQLEMRWNWKYRYPWVFFSEAPFSDEFKVRLRPFSISH